ncbi:di-heme oxidoredictase family protein [Marinibactrum halimedae]|uniref:Thiol oxidoreductase n=1 Tax=Marinibactrum halimedae TaxID=1444977 RepID=A0AA37T3Q6_9GAMM|nr:di-heme oxidoredictase family protein [Marinibactrum halimedae]MCD9457902.1 c-type cytochrome [Marinibactrum halimedae]GLS26273.1 thiol oxidoreductase [Marinibactrum halimedae]
MQKPAITLSIIPKPLTAKTVNLSSFKLLQRSSLVTSLCLLMASCGINPDSSTLGDSDNKQPQTQRHTSELNVPDKLAGEASVNNQTSNAFSLPSANMPFQQRLDFSVGNSFFRNPWVIAPASTDARDGLGPLFNTNACQNCHIKDGRGHLPANLEDNHVSMLIRLSIGDGKKPREASTPHPRYGGQLQDFAIPGHTPEANIALKYEYQTVTLADGETVSLRKPIAQFNNPAYGPLNNIQYSIRIASPVIGLGLLASIPEAAILAGADPNDRNNDGISGTANSVWNATKNKTQLGRFGWKAGQPTLKQQNAAAFNGDMGLTTPVFMNSNCTEYQTRCESAPTGGAPEVSENILQKVTFYSANLAVPKRRNADSEQVKQGARLFVETGCENCHHQKWQTTEDQSGIGLDIPQPWLTNQTIYPFTDMLLHDMGEGLDDNHPEFDAKGSEWRTPPLWGIGLTATVNGEFGYLHDGRARTLTEAILWHGGEAEQSQVQFKQLSTEDRQSLLSFLESL